MTFEEEAENSNFEEMGYESKNAISNMGPLFLYSIILACSLLVLVALKLLLNLCEKGKKLYQWISQALFFNIIIRFLIEAYLEFAVSSFINIKHVSFTSSGNKISYIVAAICCIVVLLMPVSLFVFVVHNY